MPLYPPKPKPGTIRNEHTPSERTQKGNLPTMYQYKYYNPHNLYDRNLHYPIEDPYDTEQDPETLRRITAEYANATALLTSIEMRLRARCDEVRKVFASRGGWDTRRNQGYHARINGIIGIIVENTLDLTGSDFFRGNTIRGVENGDGWVNHEEYYIAVRELIKDATGDLEQVVDTYNEVAGEAEELLARTLTPKKRTWV